LDGLGGNLDKLHYVVGVGNHRHVVRRDFDGGGAHPRGGPVTAGKGQQVTAGFVATLR
jgi:hypothetical protein